MIKELYESIKLEPFDIRWGSGLRSNSSEKDILKLLVGVFVIFICIFILFLCKIKDYKNIIILGLIWFIFLFIFLFKEHYIHCNKNSDPANKEFFEKIDTILNIIVFILWFPVILFFTFIGNGKISIARSIKYLVCIIFIDSIVFILFFKPFYCLLKILYNALFKTIFDKYIIFINAKILILILFVHLSIYLIYFIQKKFSKVKDDTLFIMYNHTIYLLYFVLLIVLVLFDIWSGFKDSIFNISTIMILLMTIAENVRQTTNSKTIS